MDVLPNEEEQMVKNLARELLEAECSPKLARDMEKDDLGYPPELWQKMADLGWLGISLPEQYGGQGLSLTYLGLICEELGRAIAPVPFHSTMVAALTIAESGSDEIEGRTAAASSQRQPRPGLGLHRRKSPFPPGNHTLPGHRGWR